MAVASFGNTPTVGLDTNYDFVPSALEGAQAGQAMRGISALQGIDINNPDSVNQGIGSLVRSGAFEQGSALMGLNLQRFKNQAFINTFQNNPFTGDQSQQQPQGGAPQQQPTQAAQPTPEQAAQRVKVMQTAKAGIDAAINANDPTLRSAQIDATTGQLASMGVPQEYISHMLGDNPDTPHLQSLSDNIGQWLQHPDFGGAAQAAGAQPVAPGLHPNAQSFVQAPNPLLRPNVLNWLAQRGMLGVDDKNMIEALKAGQGYTGVVAPGQAVAFGGNVQTPATYAPEKLAPGEGLVSPNTGQQIGQTQPFKPEFQNVPPGNTPAVFQPSNLGAGGGGSMPPPAVAPTSSTGQGTGPGKYNNPAGVTPLAHGKWPGQTDVAPNGMVVFDNPTDGYNAADKNLVAYNGEGINTVAGVINKWTPPGHGNPDQAPRIATIARQMGVAPNAPIDLGNPLVRHQLLAAMIPGEGTAGGASAQQAQAAPTPVNLPGVSMGAPRQLYTPPSPIAGAPGLHQTNTATGEVSAPVAGSMADPNAVRETTLALPEVKDAQNALATWQAMKANAPTMTGPAAQSMLAGFVRSISGLGERQQNISALMDTFGWPLKVQSEFQKAFSGQGPLTEQMKQQLLDASYNFVQSHYDLANRIVQGQRQFLAGKNGPSSAHDLDNILGTAPNHFYLTPPPASARIVGQVVESPKGAYRWDGRNWDKVG